MAFSYTIDATDFAAAWGQVELIFYVVFVAMFVLAMYIYHCNKVTTTRYLLYSTSAMFVLGTMQITLKVVIAAIVLNTVKLAVQGGSLVRSTSVHDRLAFVRYLILNANNALTDSLFMYRCYVVWGRTLSIIFLPIAMLATTTVLGFITTVRFADYQFNSEFNPTIFASFAMSVLTNCTLTALTAGRMWWVGREVRRASNLPGTRSYNTAVVMILESGSLYSVCVIALVVSGAFLPNPSATVVNNVLTGAMPQVVNIVPTLIAVRVGLSRGIEARWIDRTSGSANARRSEIEARVQCRKHVIHFTPAIRTRRINQIEYCSASPIRSSPLLQCRQWSNLWFGLNTTNSESGQWALWSVFNTKYHTCKKNTPLKISTPTFFTEIYTGGTESQVQLLQNIPHTPDS
ncbi:hypothetical protein DFH08DRAFT_817605 [Mycena albidolilacea]|uniref:Uncharacterized protein n=1 Tax=Mycena albidolilacea TaxID=1033008 RepID=A0AAD6ZHW6_9AGAR|nr:hypothetical protein DFH08DRAFT_817605 [Mycena albidolilacea]